MPILAAFALPHPPLAVAGVGRGQEREIDRTLAGYREVARRIAALAPDVLVVSSPHATAYYDYIHISPGACASGDFAQFGDSADELSCDYDEELVRAISDEAILAGVPAGTEGQRDPALDHGTMVPLSFIQAAGTRCPIVRIGISGMSGLDHYLFGQCVARAADKLGRRAVWVASGDLSHKLKKTGPYGFAAEGPVFDQEICDIFETGDFGRLLRMDDTLCDKAAECGLPSFQMMAGSLDGQGVKGELLSYEGPFGVGYGVAAFTPLGPAPDRNFADMARQKVAWQAKANQAGEDQLVSLARASLETWVLKHQAITLPDDLPDELAHRRAGCFVSLHKDGQLRGCIGTLGPTRASLALEIVNNAISAGTRDPRFPRVRPDELDLLTYSVDVLGEAQEVADQSELDPARYGVIVSTSDGRRGVLLPDLEGVDSVNQQVSIACQKGGIDPREPYTLQRFEVVRHKAGL